MTISRNISTFAQSTSQSNRLSDLRFLMSDLQRKVSTQKNFETYTGFGTDAFNLQLLHAKAPMASTYIKNIDKTTTALKQTTDLMSKMSSIGSDLIKSINTRTGDKAGLDNLALQAKQSLDFVQDILNQKGIDGNYLFSGSDIKNPPFINNSTLNSNFNNDVTQWLNGTITNQQMMDNTDALTSSNLGLAPGLSNAGTRNIRIGDKLDIEYGIKANTSGIKNLIRALTFAANMKFPGPGDVAQKTELDTVFSHIASIAGTATSEITDENIKMAGKFSLLNSVKDNHMRDLSLFETQIGKMENSDPAESLIKLQMIQTQLTASYQVTKIIGQLSLTNFI